MGTTNAEWHLRHPMPDRPTPHQRAEWHYEHARNCSCREMTPSIAALLISEGFEIPKPQADRAGG